MNEVLNIYKPIGITSYDVIRELKKKYPNQKIGHAGTLDPLADGVLICLVGDKANQRQEEFMNCSKEYVFEVLFGFGTDTFDILGFPLKNINYHIDETLTKAEAEVSKLTGTFMQQVPLFSAVKVKGKPLYRWYLAGKIKEVEVPVKEIHIEKIEIISKEIIELEKLNQNIQSLLETVKSGFRNEDIKIKWQELFKNDEVKSQPNFLVMTIKAEVSKGTYVRAIANDLGEMIGVPACTMKITRIRVGEMKIENSQKIL